ncbi:MAG: molybdenum-pterin-binding protein [Acidobacteria bacterium]|nr:MAG: molybdenum-pterin-binding protein [Acidobacteriota bacterium]
MELLRLPEAARALGVSPPTLKQWIYRGKLRTVTTAGGHHRVPRTEIDRLLFRKTGRPRKGASHGKARGATGGLPLRQTTVEAGAGLGHIISGRNQLLGRIVELRTVGLLAKVSLDVGGQRVTAIITRDACRDLGLKKGQTAAALIKATEVMIIRPVGREL